MRFRLDKSHPNTAPRRQWSSKAFVLLFESWLQRMGEVMKVICWRSAGWVVWYGIPQNVGSILLNLHRCTGWVGSKLWGQEGRIPKLPELKWHDETILLGPSIHGNLHSENLIQKNSELLRLESLVSIRKTRPKNWRSWLRYLDMWIFSFLTLCYVETWNPAIDKKKWLHGRICGGTVGQCSSPMVCRVLEDVSRHVYLLWTREHWTKGPLVFWFCFLMGESTWPHRRIKTIIFRHTCWINV